MECAAFHPLETPRLRLRKLDMGDVDAYFHRIGSSKAVTRYMLWEPHKDISESTASIQKALPRYETGKYYRWAIALKSDDSLIGILDLLKFDEAAVTCSFAYMLGEDFWNQGYGTEAVAAAFDFAFRELQIDTILCDHFAENPASGAVMQKAGMLPTGVIPRKYEKHGIFHDAVTYRITKEDWFQKARR